MIQTGLQPPSSPIAQSEPIDVPDTSLVLEELMAYLGLYWCDHCQTLHPVTKPPAVEQPVHMGTVGPFQSLVGPGNP